MLVKAVEYGSLVSYSSGIINSTGWESTLIIGAETDLITFQNLATCLNFWLFQRDKNQT